MFSTGGIREKTIYHFTWHYTNTWSAQTYMLCSRTRRTSKNRKWSIDFAQTLIVRHFVRLNCRVNFRELHSCTVVARTVQGSKCQYYLNVENTGIKSMSNTGMHTGNSINTRFFLSLLQKLDDVRKLDGTLVESHRSIPQQHHPQYPQYQDHHRHHPNYHGFFLFFISAAEE